MKILLVEDEELVRKFVREVIQMTYPDVMVVEATGYSSALPHIVAQEFDLILTDLQSTDPQDQGKTGLHTIEEVQRLRFGTPCILMTGNPTHADVAEFQRRWPGMPLVQKPVQITELIDAITKELAKAQKP